MWDIILVHSGKQLICPGLSSLMHFNPFTRSHATPRISHAEKRDNLSRTCTITAEFIALSTLELNRVKCHLPANQKLGCCCFRLNDAILPHVRSLLGNMDECKLEEKDPMNAVGNPFIYFFLF